MNNTKNNNKKSGGKKILCWIVAIAIVLAVVSLALFNQALDSGWLDRSMDAMKTENFTVSIAGMEYFYRTVANSYISMYQSYGMSSYINIDSSISHKKQECSMTQSGTWFDFFLTTTKAEVSNILSCCEAAKAEGITLTDEDKASIDKEIATIKTNADTYGYSLNQYLTAVYGSAVNESVVRDCLELKYLYNRYITAHVDAADTSDEAVDAIYSENKSDYDVVEYLNFVFDYNDLYLDEEEQAKAESADSESTAAPADTAEAAESTAADESTAAEDAEITEDAEATEDAEEVESESADETTSAEPEEVREPYSTTDRNTAIEKSHADADELLAALKSAASLSEKQQVFEDFIKDYLTDALGLTDEQYAKNKDNFSVKATYKKDDEIIAWAFDEKTAAGDVKMFTEKEEHEHKEGDDETKLADVYTVVLVTKTAGRDESLATADIRHILFSNDDYEDDTKAKEVYEELKAVLGTDEFTAKFEELAKEYSADDSNKDNGGLMEDLAKGSTVTEFDDWVFGGENTKGSLGIVETKDYGWHVVYFEDEGLPAWKNDIISKIKSDANSEAETKASETYKITQDDNKMSKWIDA